MFDKFTIKYKILNSSIDNKYNVYNQWCENADYYWLVRFARKHFPQNTKTVNIFGPLGNPFFIRKKFDGIKVFHTNEDVDHLFTKLHLEYGDYALSTVDLAIGFGNVKSEKYVRFPYWLTTTFAPESTEDDIKRRIKEINSVSYNKSQECVLINKHDKKGTREMIYNGVKDILDVKCAGAWKNNTRDLWDKYNNDKEAYVKTFKFNICPENDNTKNYVTEKLFDAFICGCVPLYYGSNNDPEPGVINKAAVIFWNKGKDNSANRELVKLLNASQKEYDDFIRQEKITAYGEEWIISRFALLKDHFKRILE